MNAQRMSPVRRCGRQGRLLRHCDRASLCGTSYRVSEHWQRGDDRPQPWLMEAQPQMFVELSEELATLKQIKNGQRVKAVSSRVPWSARHRDQAL